MKIFIKTKFLYFLFLIVLFLVPGCIFKKQGRAPEANPVIITPAPQPAPIEEIKPVEYAIASPTENSQDVESFILEENKDNPFLPNPATKEYEEIALDKIETADKEKDNAKYGFETIYFDFDKKNIRSDQQNKVNKDLERIKEITKDQNYEIVIEGHACDSAGTEQYNTLLSEDRAKTIKEYFVKNGINKDCLETVGRGSKNLIVPFGTREEQAPNRRVELYAYRK